jgi:uncharacterized protein (TIGR01777 family)
MYNYPMNILIIGGTGFLGSALSRDLNSSGHEVVVSTRKNTTSKKKLTWNPPELIPAEKISMFDAVINLAGESIFSKRWTDEKKEHIRSSRINTTHYLVQSMNNSEKRPEVLINASAIGYYGPHGDEEVDEDTPPGDDFLSGVCKDWEAAALKAEGLGIRVVITRIGLVLGAGGGPLSMMMPAFKAFLGGYIGTGKQWMSWVHQDDISGFIRYALENDSVAGQYNLVSPHPLRNKDFGSVLGKALGRPSFFPVPGFALKAALGEFGDVLLTGQRVVPDKVIKAGYTFKYQELDQALQSIINT